MDEDLPVESASIPQAAPGQPWFAILVSALAVGLILYLPLEHSLTSGLDGAAYWVVRLLPDSLIVLLAVIALARAGRHPTRYHVLLALLGLVVAGIVAVDIVRGNGASDAINATRVLVRFAALGLIVASCASDLPGLPKIVLVAILLAGVVQMSVGLIQLIGALGASQPVVLYGTTGRYDRFGLMVAAGLLALLALAASGPRRWHLGLIVLACAMLYFSSSRQSMLAVAVASLIIVFWPHVHRYGRALAVGLSVMCLLMVMVTSSRTEFTSAGDEDGVLAPGITAPTGGAMATSPPRRLGATSISTSLTGNFRLYLNLILAPWAAAQEPFIGFGPARHDRTDADPRLVSRVEADGVEWDYARQFLNDSNYAILFLQFGLLAPVAFLTLLVGTLTVAARRAWRNPDPLALFAVMFGCAALLTATLGPSFEIRPISAILWVALFVVVGWRERAVAS